jgi:hypothetical protein
MAKNGSSATDERDAVADAVDDGFKALLERGRSVADHVPDAIEEARSAVGAAQSQLDLLSDRGVIAAVGFSAGMTSGLLLAGAPRPVLAISLLPLALTVRAALTRGVRLSRLVN